MNDIASIAPLIANKPQMSGNDSAATQASGVSFMDMVKTGINSVRSAQSESESLTAQAVAGKADMSQVVQSIAKAEVMLQTMVSVRDRLLSAYQELMNTRI